MNQPATDAGLQRRRRLCIVLVAMVVGWHWFSEDFHPVVTNDGVGYITHALALERFGMVRSGYRPAGYPAFLSGAFALAESHGVDPLSFVPVLQRALLLLTTVALIWFLGVWSVPIVLILLHVDLLGLSNFFLVEPLGLVLTIICLIGLYMHAAGGRQMALAPLVVAGLAMAAVSLLRSSYLPLSFLFVPVFFYHVIWKPAGWFKHALVVAVTGVACAAGLLAISAENLEEYGEFSPATGNARAAYYGAYYAALRSAPEQMAAPEMAEFYDGGNPYKYIHRIDALDVPYQEKAEIFASRADALLQAAGLSRGVEVAKTTWYFGLGGRDNDLRNHLDVKLDPGNPEGALKRQLSNSTARNIGYQEFLNRFNGGARPILVSSGSVIKPAFPFSLEAPYRYIAAVGFVLCVAGGFLLSGLLRGLAIASACAYLSICLLYGIHLVDIWRYTLVNFGIASVSGAFCARALWQLVAR